MDDKVNEIFLRNERKNKIKIKWRESNPWFTTLP